MASTHNQASNVDLFDAYFRRADLDRDGRISGSEAVVFFQGSGLPKQVLAQIWAFANQSQSGFLGRVEFYNALKLVTVAQSKQELTPEIVKAALYGPAAAKIPAPQINFSATVAPQLNSSAAASVLQIGPVNPASYQNAGIRGTPIPPNLSGNRKNFPSQESFIPRPPQITSASSSLPSNVSTQGFSKVVNVGANHPVSSSISSGGVGSTIGGAPAVPSSQVSAGGISPTSNQVGPNAALPSNPSEKVVKDSKLLNASSNGGNMFSATSSQPKQEPQGVSSGSSLLSSAIVPVSGAKQHSIRTTTPEYVQSSFATQPVGQQHQQAQPLLKQNQPASIQTHNMSIPSGLPAGVQKSTSGQPQSPWPRMAQTDVQKYTKVFVEVDTDRDGKITGEQAHNLFLSWRLPREVLKQVWDLSDQDNDSMLSLREFCIALHLMERYREGYVLPAVLPSNIILDLSIIGQPATHYNAVAWGTSSEGFKQQPGMTGFAARQAQPSTSWPPRPATVPLSDEGPENKQQKSRVPVLEKNLINQLGSDEQNSINSKFQDAMEADKKVEELEKEILDSREKIEFCHAKMQELVLYKSRCDNRLNEITERISADKREVENLAKKYEDKCKQVGDLASKLSTEEATFRDIQEKKLELYQAIVKMEQDDGADASLQARANFIQSDLDELVKSLNERCKKYGLRAKPTALVELHFGWQHGIQEGAADWDENWDKFEEEGFTFVKELTLDVQNILAPPKEKLLLTSNRKTSAIDSPTSAASLESNDKSEKPQNTDEQTVENGSAYSKRKDESAKSARNSPFARSAVESPSKYFADSNDGKITTGDSSLHDHEIIQETESDHGGVKSVFSGDKFFDEPNWGTFDTNDDVDSVWGFNPSSTSKDTDHDRAGDNYFFGSGELGLNPIRTGSPQASDLFQKSSRFSFDDSVPSTPLFSSNISPQKSKEWSEPAFDNFSRFDSSNTHDSGFDDFLSSSRDFDHGHGFPAFDDSDPFGSGPFRTSSETQTPKRASDNWSAF
ncbi:hypothetical protein L6164_004672 [Bauhinia variegata]|uniref:Uncharacterized protein n=1 Tax=Bauhinia variegata TaxID=167791 RepID=A0ACB9PNT9_BAUVA|nr:hypothetical protein L6164_004672 [Bauhinia variegata]